MISIPTASRRQFSRLAASAARVLPRPAAFERLRRILVATHGSASADAAVSAARSLARRSGASFELVTVFAPRIPMPFSPNRTALAQCEPPDRAEAQRLVEMVQRQRRRLAPEFNSDARPLRVEVGDPGATIVRLARERSADLVMVGIGRRDPGFRRVGERTALCVARYLDVPLLAAADECEDPSTCLIAFPDGRVHEQTLRAAVTCVLPHGKLLIAFPDGFSADDAIAIPSAPMREWVTQVCGPALASHVEQLELTRVDISGDMLAGILRVADQVKAELIAIPNRGDPGPVRVFLPNLAEPLLLGARCSVLVVPDARETTPVNRGHDAGDSSRR